MLRLMVATLVALGLCSASSAQAAPGGCRPEPASSHVVSRTVHGSQGRIGTQFRAVTVTVSCQAGGLRTVKTSRSSWGAVFWRS